MGGTTILRIRLKEEVDTSSLYGPRDAHLRAVENAFGLRITARGHEIVLDGPEEAVKTTENLISQISSLLSEGYILKQEDVLFAIKTLQQHKETLLKEVFGEAVSLPTQKRLVTPKSPAQMEYLQAIRTYDVVIGIGPAGTGKTYLAMAMAVSCLLQRQVNRIILARPAVEAGEKLGFLPGDMYEKVNPYLRPLYDALYDMMDMEKANRMIERGDIEIAPLAFMRGRTLNDSFVILDEAQNATSEQMKMFLTRLGFGSKTVITGDITQVDLPVEKISGLIAIQDILSPIEGIRFVYFSDKDVVRHKLVQEIIKAYERFDTGLIPRRRPGGA
ncbi:MAG: PhoH family protein [Nitrospirae bacterium]|nr:PhoH family protein [Nitrospirota bacterium]